MSEHSKEPWRIHRRFATTVEDQGGRYVASTGGYQSNAVDPEELESHLQANAARIVACVNALAGIPTEQLAGLGDALEAAREALETGMYALTDAHDLAQTELNKRADECAGALAKLNALR